MDQSSQSPTTTAEQDLRTAGQRRINLIWEYTQAGIAISVVFANIFYIFALLFTGEVAPSVAAAAGLLSNAFFLVIGFYFGRTNHARIGDDPDRRLRVGPMDDR
jgi:hypothetical protein